MPRNHPLALVPLLTAACVWVMPAAAQEPPRSADVVVEGARTRPSGWRTAETRHVIVFSDGSEAELVRLTRNLEKLHFLLSGLLGRADAADDTVKLRVTLIGGVAEFDAMALGNRRWQQGPFAAGFAIGRYYDPREDGAVMATTRIDQRAVLERGVALSQLAGIALPGLQADPLDPGRGAFGGANGSALLGLTDSALPIPAVNERSVPITAESLLYGGFAQHFLLTYFPAVYPRWYLDGFAQVFATIRVESDGVIEYGRAPVGSGAVLERHGGYPLADVLSGRYLAANPSRTGWTPVHAWMLTHYLFFSDARRPQLRRYLMALANAVSGEEAARAFGDVDVLAREVRGYYRARKPFERLTYPRERIEDPVISRLSEGAAAFVKGRLELGARVELPPPSPTADPAEDKARTEATRARDGWLAGLRRTAGRYPADAPAQLLLAEAECRSNQWTPCLAAAERTLALSPQAPSALVWKGVAQMRLAAGASDAAFLAGRAGIVRANRLDPEAPLPLLAYGRSFGDAGAAPTDRAVDALAKAVSLVPNAPASRLSLAAALAARGQVAAARPVLLPVANGAYDSPERPRARALLATVDAAAR